MPQIYDDPIAPRRRRKYGTSGPTTEVQQTDKPQQQGNYSTLGSVERESQGTLPTGLAFALAGIDQDEKRLKRAVRLLSRDVDISPRFLFGDDALENYDDPIAGGRMTAQTLNRMTAFAPAILASMFRDAAAGESPVQRYGRVREETRGVTSEVNLGRVSKFASALAQQQPELDANALIYTAAHLARQGVSPKTFAQNLEAVTKWARETGQAIEPGHEERPRRVKRVEGVSWDTQTYVALLATKDKQKLETNLDVVKYLLPPEVQKRIAAGERLEEFLATEAASGTQAVRPGESSQELAEGIITQEQSGALIQARLMAVQPGQSDFFAEAQALATKVHLDATAFERTWLGRQLGRVGGFFNEVWKATEKGLVEVGSVVSAPALFAVAAVPGGKSYEDAWDFIQKNRHYAYQRINKGDTVGDIVVDGFGLDPWMGTAFDLWAGWYADPFNIVGKGINIGRGLRVAPELLEKSIQFRRGFGAYGRAEKSLDVAIFGTPAERWVRAQESFVNSSAIKRLWNALYDGNTSYFRRMDLFRVNFEARGAFDYQFMKALRDKVLQYHPTATADSLKDFKQGILAHFGNRPLPGSLAEEVVRIRTEGASVVAARAKALKIAEEEGAVAADLVEDVLTPKLFRFEVPQYRLGGTGRFGPRTLGRRAVTSELVTSTRLGKRAARLPSINPGRVLNFEDDPGVYVRLHARRGGVFTEQEVRRYESMADEILNIGPGKEDRLAALIDEINQAHFDRIADRYRLSPEVRNELYQDIYEPVTDLNQRFTAFGTREVDEGIAPVTDILLETQRKNTMFVADPMHVENLIQRYVGVPRRLRQTFQRAAESLGLREMPEIDSALGRWHDGMVWGTEALGEMGRAYRRFWKGYTVARFGYIPRVILFDENLRFLVSTSSLAERILAQKTFGRVFEAVGGKRFATRAFEFGDSEINATLPWRYSREALASTAIRSADAADELVRDSSLFFRAEQADGGWDVLYPSRKPAERTRHLKSWNRTLVHEFGNSVPGREALEAVAKGKSIEETRELLEQWARRAENVPLRQQGIAIADDEVRGWADDLAKMAHAYTMEGTTYQRAIAQAVLDGADDLRPILDQVPWRDRPPVHGPTIKSVTGGPRLGPTQLVDVLYAGFVRIPEDILNRQPFYRVWKARAERAYLAHLAEQSGGIRTPYILSSEPTIERAALRKAAPKGKYIYHSTTEDAFDSIRTSGLEPQAPRGSRVTGTEGTQMADIADELYSRWEDGGVDARVFFADEGAETVTLTNRGKVLLRAPRDKVDLTRGVYGSERFSNARVPNQVIEYLGGDMKWHKAMPVVKVNAEVRKVIDHASRDFALGVVKQTMFDFTKQSRFTELLQFLAPFPQPFFEGFQAWGHLVVQHPELIGRTRALFQFGVDQGWVKKDKDSGEWVVPMGAWASVARTMGILPDRIKDTLGFTAPLRSFNMLTALSVELPATMPVFGKIVGGVPVPVPGIDPLALVVLQKLFGNSSNRQLTGWLWAYGPAKVIPRQLELLLNKLDPDSINEDQLKSYADEILKEYQRQGLDVGEDGQPVSREQLTRWALEDARNLITARNFASMFSPASLQVRFDHDEIEETYNTIIEHDGPDAAQEWLEREHPELTLIGLSKYYYTKQYEDDRTHEKLTAPKIPSSQLFAELVGTEWGGEFMRRFPEWGAILLVGLNPDIAYEYNPAVRAKQAAEGLIKTKNPDDFWGQGENVKVWKEIDGFYKETWNPRAEVIENLGLDDQDVAYQRLILQRQEFFNDLYIRHPSWVQNNLEPKEVDKAGNVLAWDWPGDAKDTPLPVVLHDARMIANLQGFQEFPGIKALRTYLEGRDDIEQDMHRLGISDIESQAAQDAGLTRRFEELKRRAIEGPPQVELYQGRVREEREGANPLADYQSVMTQFIEGYFRGDLTGLPSNTREKLKGQETVWIAEGGPRGEGPILLADAVERFDTGVERLKDAARQDFDFDYERNQSYQDLRNFIDEQYRNNPKVVQSWWDLEVPKYKKREYKESLVSLPSVFWSRWDWKVMGLNMSDQAANWLKAIGQARVDIARREEADPEYSESEGYEAIDRFVKQHRGKDKTFDAAIAAMNRWTYPVEAAGLAKQPGKVGDAWEAVVRVFDEAQDAIDKYNAIARARHAAELTGVNAIFDKDEAKAYDALQDQLLDWVKEWHDVAPGFKQQWYDLQEALGDPLIGGLFLPDSYFGPLGVTG